MVATLVVPEEDFRGAHEADDVLGGPALMLMVGPLMLYLVVRPSEKS